METLSCTACVWSCHAADAAPIHCNSYWLQTTPSPLSSGEIDGGSQAELDSPGAQYRRRKQQELEQRAGMHLDCGVDNFRTSSERSSAECSAAGGSSDGPGGPAVPDNADRAINPAGPVPDSAAMLVPASQTASGQLQRVRDGSAGSSPPTPRHAGTRGRGPLAFGPGDGTRAMALAARFDSIVAGNRTHHHQGWPAGLRDSPDANATPPSPSPLRNAGI